MVKILEYTKPSRYRIMYYHAPPTTPQEYVLILWGSDILIVICPTPRVSRASAFTREDGSGATPLLKLLH